MKKTAKWSAIVATIMFFGALGSVVFEHYLVPKLAASPRLSRIGAFRSASENVTVISKTEQVTVKEDDSVNRIVGRSGMAVVNILSIGTTLSPEPTESHLNGTGLIVTSDGVVVTYRSAIQERNATYKVFLFHGGVNDAELIGIDEFSNLAFLKIASGNVPIAGFTSVDQLKPGKKLVAIGNTFGEYQNSYSAGVLSGHQKQFNIAPSSVSSSEKLEGVFEVDFDGDPRYIGGPMVDYNGDVAGIVGSVTRNNQIYHFLIPPQFVRNSLDRILSDALAPRPTLGISYLSLSKSYAFANKLSRDRGALVYAPSGRQSAAVLAGSPAAKSGIRVGDIITRVNGKEVDLENPLSNTISDYHIGDTVIVSILRQSQELELSVVLE